VQICIAGRGRPAADWQAVGPRLAERGELVTLDLGGCDADELRRIARSRAPGGTVLIGHSMGALVAMQAAAAEPPLFTGLVMTDGFYPPSRNGRTITATAADYTRHRLLFAAGALRRRPNRATRVATPRLRSLMSLGLRPATFHSIADRVACPVLLVHGSRDHHVPSAFAAAAAARHPSWDLRMIDSGHFPHRDAAEAWLAVVEDWLEERTEPGRARSLT
jgi:pimeloyl-ACP methyl ester carboxylesterase